jgi:DNA (cytosine-5)-methyltransferase 1
MVLRQVLNDLENEGFKSQCIIIPASGIGAWHQRKRIWILAYSNNNGSYRSQGNATKQSSNEQKDRLSFRDDKDVPNTNTGFSIRENEEIQTGRNAFDSIYKSGERQWWETESKLRGIPDGLSTKLHEDRSNRIRALGNSIVPQIARQIGLSIMEAELNG